jgi:hypothetical protein
MCSRPRRSHHHLVTGRADGEDGFAGVQRPDTRESNDRSPLFGAQARATTREVPAPLI